MLRAVATADGGQSGIETTQTISGAGTVTISSVTNGRAQNVIITTTGAVTLNIPAPNASSPLGRINITDQSGSPNVTVTPASGLINGASNLLINNPYESANLLDTGSTWGIQ